MAFNGAWDMPLRKVVESFPLIITVYDTTDKEEDKIINTEEIDYSNREHRLWLGRITFWAVNKGYVVETKKK